VTSRKARDFNSLQWDPGFLERSPMLEPLRARAATLSSAEDWPDASAVEALLSGRAVSTAAGLPLRLVAETGREPYENRIRERGEMHYRDRDWHDLLNALVWLTYPRTKAALNDAQSAASRSAETPARVSQRGARCDALTLFDENGAIVVSTEPTLLDDLRCFRWKQLFWKRRSEVERSLRVFVFGHALLHKALAPYVGMTAHALLLSVGEDFVAHDSIAQTAAVDLLAPEAVAQIATPRALTPLPVLGIPGWWADNAHEAFYDNVAYFRPGRRNHSM
jgi:hypothetical protein